MLTIEASCVFQSEEEPREEDEEGQSGMAVWLRGRALAEHAQGLGPTLSGLQNRKRGREALRDEKKMEERTHRRDN